MYNSHPYLVKGGNKSSLYVDGRLMFYEFLWGMSSIALFIKQEFSLYLVILVWNVL